MDQEVPGSRPGFGSNNGKTCMRCMAFQPKCGIEATGRRKGKARAVDHRAVSRPGFGSKFADISADETFSPWSVPAPLPSPSGRDGDMGGEKDRSSAGRAALQAGRGFKSRRSGNTGDHRIAKRHGSRPAAGVTGRHRSGRRFPEGRGQGREPSGASGMMLRGSTSR